MSLEGNNFQQIEPTVVINGNSTLLGTTLRSLGEFIHQYIKEPVVANPCTVVITVPANTVVHYTYGPQYPTARVDNINCFKYTGPISLTNNKASDGTALYIVAFKADVNGKPTQNDQSKLVIAKFKITK